MDRRLRPTFKSSKRHSSSMNDPSRNLNPNQPFTQFDSENLSYHGRTELRHFPEFSQPLDNQSFRSYYSDNEVKSPGQLEPTPFVNNPSLNWDPRAILSNLSLLDQKIHQAEDIVRSIINKEGQLSIQPKELAAQQQLVTTDLTSIIIQLISTAGSLLPSVKNTLLSANPSIGQLDSIIDATSQQNESSPSEITKVKEYDELIKGFGDCGGEGTEFVPIEDHDVKDSEDGMDGENLPPGSYEILQLEKEEILAPHTHFCSICGKGFKRDANLRMHMRGHGDEYKTPAALAKPSKESNSDPVIIKRYSCPFAGCKRNREHKKFQPLKTFLCVKNHYKRSHCDKRYICNRCNSKKFSVMADLKTHEKHCGRDRWICSCGTTFSRKDKLFGHVALFQGHTPALAAEEAKGSGASDQMRINEAMNRMESTGYDFTRSSMDNVNDLDIGDFDDDRGYLSAMNFDSCNFGGLDVPRLAFDVSESSFPFLPPGSSNLFRKNGEN